MRKSFLFEKVSRHDLLTFFAITLFYFFEAGQMSYFNVLAQTFLSLGIYHHDQIASLSAAYYYGDVVGLLPVGFMLDRFPMRKTLLFAILGSILAAFLLFISVNIYLQWFARFFCGFFGGTFSFIGGIRILALLFSKRFTLYVGLFLAAGMLGGLVCQYPLLMLVNDYGIKSAMLIMASFGILVILINFLCLHPTYENTHHNKTTINSKQLLNSLLMILKNKKNWFDCILVIFLDTPVSIIGTLWGVVIFIHLFQFTDIHSTYVVMALFIGLMIGLPTWGLIADKFQHPEWIVLVGSGVSFLTLLPQLFSIPLSLSIVLALYFLLGFFSSCQTLCFTWLTKNMKPELVGTNSAFNSMVFMSANGLVKQLSGMMLAGSLCFFSVDVTKNVLLFISVLMLLAFGGVLIRRKIFNKLRSHPSPMGEWRAGLRCE